MHLKLQGTYQVKIGEDATWKSEQHRPLLTHITATADRYRVEPKMHVIQRDQILLLWWRWLLDGASGVICATSHDC